MFKAKPTLKSTLGKVNQFISELKSGIESHEREVAIVEKTIEELYTTRDCLSNEIFQAKQLICTLSGTNS